MESAGFKRTRKASNRNSHPCDFCRYKRAACLLHGQPPCELCRRQGKECTFVGGPNKRIRVLERCQSDSSDGAKDCRHAPASSDTDMRSPLADTDSPGGEASFNRDTEDSTSPTSSQAETPPALVRKEDMSFSSSLDAKVGHNAQVIGLSGESDPFLLRLYHFDEKDECAFQQLQVRNMGMDDGVPVQFMLQRNSLANKAQPGGLGASESDITSEIAGMFPDSVGKRLISL